MFRLVQMSSSPYGPANVGWYRADAPDQIGLVHVYPDRSGVGVLRHIRSGGWGSGRRRYPWIGDPAYGMEGENDIIVAFPPSRMDQPLEGLRATERTASYPFSPLMPGR